MYTGVWTKYLPVIKILLKKAVAAEQSLDLNKPDFEKAGISRNGNHKFNLEFQNGKVVNGITASPLAKKLASVLMEDERVKETLVQNDYTISMNTKFQLTIKHLAKQPLES